MVQWRACRGEGWEGGATGGESTTGKCSQQREKAKAEREQGKQDGGGTGEQNAQEKEAALRYRLQMSAITLTRAGEEAGEDGGRLVKVLRGIAASAGVLPPQKEGEAKAVVEVIGDTLRRRD